MGIISSLFAWVPSPLSGFVYAAVGLFGIAVLCAIIKLIFDVISFILTCFKVIGGTLLGL